MFDQGRHYVLGTNVNIAALDIYHVVSFSFLKQHHDLTPY